MESSAVMDMCSREPQCLARKLGRIATSQRASRAFTGRLRKHTPPPTPFATRLASTLHAIHCQEATRFYTESSLESSFSPAIAPYPSTFVTNVPPRPQRRSTTRYGAQQPLPRPQPLESLCTPRRKPHEPPAAIATAATTAATATAAAATTPTAEHPAPRLRRRQPGTQPQPLRRPQPDGLPVKCRRHRRRPRGRAGSPREHRRGKWRHRAGWPRGAHALCSRCAAAGKRGAGPGRRKGHRRPADT
jgi:hypothetical protein